MTASISGDCEQHTVAHLADGSIHNAHCARIVNQQPIDGRSRVRGILPSTESDAGAERPSHDFASRAIDLSSIWPFDHIPEVFRVPASNQIKLAAFLEFFQ